MKLARRCRSFFPPERVAPLILLVLAASCSGDSTSPNSPTLPAAARGAPASSLSNSATRQTLGVSQAKKVPLLPPAGTIYFGAYVNYLKTLGPYEAQTAEFESEIGRHLALHGEYYTWTDTFPSAPEVDDWKNDRIPVVSWDCGDTDADVANGNQDSVITAVATAFKTYKHKAFLRWFWEMNLPYAEEDRNECVGPDDINGQFDPTDYIAAWVHIRAIFKKVGATNVVWLWNPSGNLAIDPRPYYPGATESDWIGFDHYDVTGDDGLLNTLSAPYTLLNQTYPSQPIMVGETGSPGKDNNQETYLGTAPAVLQANFPAILGFIYYDAYGHRQDWRLTSAGITGAKTAGATQYFSAFEQQKK